jgi:hypothetical protein
MSIVPASRLDASDLALLGNNLTSKTASPRKIRRRRAQLQAVNRSLSLLGEQVQRLYRSPLRQGTGLSSHPA